MRKSGRIVAEVLDGLRKLIKPGISTLALDQWAEKKIRDRGAIPSFKGYNGFPSTLCTSIDSQVVHGIPSDRRLQEGEIISVDVGAVMGGWHGDAARTYAVGDVDNETRRLMDTTQASLEIGLAQAKIGNRLSDIGHAIQKYVEAAGFSVVRDFVGHGIGKNLHEDPQIPNFGEPHQGVLLKHGMIMAIEPMVNAGKFPVKILDDHWTVVTRDGKRSAHFENTIAILDSGMEVLTV